MFGNNYSAQVVCAFCHGVLIHFHFMEKITLNSISSLLNNVGTIFKSAAYISRIHEYIHIVILCSSFKVQWANFVYFAKSYCRIKLGELLD